MFAVSSAVLMTDQACNFPSTMLGVRQLFDNLGAMIHIGVWMIGFLARKKFSCIFSESVKHFRSGCSS